MRYVEDRFDELIGLLARFPLLVLTEDLADAVARPVGFGAGFLPPRNTFVSTRNLLPGLAFAEIYPRTGGEDTDLAIRC